MNSHLNSLTIAAILGMNKLKESIILGKQASVRLNVLVVGKRGLGKKSFMKAMLQKYISIENLNFVINDKKDGSIERLGEFELECDSAKIQLHLYECPGYGDFINNEFCYNVIRNDLEQRHCSWRNIDGQLLLEDERMALDNRIHCALYFIAPHHLSCIDVAFFDHLSDIVPIVPILAKVDTMNFTELNIHMNNVVRHLSQVSKKRKFYDFKENMNQFDKNLDNFNDENLSDDLNSVTIESDEMMNDLGVKNDSVWLIGEALSRDKENRDKEHSPNCFTDCISNRYYQQANVFAVSSSPTYFRIYSWGTFDIKDKTISDFLRLQYLLFEKGEHIQGLRKETQLITLALFQGKMKSAVRPANETTGATAVAALCLLAPMAIAALYDLFSAQRPVFSTYLPILSILCMTVLLWLFRNMTV